MSAFGETRYVAAFAAAINDAGLRLNDREVAALDYLVWGLWSWSKGIKLEVFFRFFYPFIGGTAVSHSFNLANPAIGRIIWSGTITHDANGVTSVGTAARGKTGVKLASTAKSSAYVGCGVYCRSTANMQAMMGNAKVGGTYNGISLSGRDTSGHAYYYNHTATLYCSVAISDSRNVFTGVRDSVGLYLYNGGNSPANSALGDGGNPNNPLTEFVLFDDGTNTGGSVCNLAIAWLSNRVEGGTAGMTVLYEQEGFYLVLEDYNWYLGRQVFT